MGYIRRIDPENELVWIDFDEKLAAYGFEQLGELDHAFAMTVHKSQGSEYRAVVLAAGRAPGPAAEPGSFVHGGYPGTGDAGGGGDPSVVDAMIDNGRKTRAVHRAAGPADG